MSPLAHHPKNLTTNPPDLHPRPLPLPETLEFLGCLLDVSFYELLFFSRRVCRGAGFRMGGIEARGLRKARGGVGFGPTAATGGRRAVERPAGLPTGDARGRAWRR